MKIYLAYKFDGADKTQLRQYIEDITKVLESLGHKTYAFFRDAQHYGEVKMSIDEVVESAMGAIDSCDLILAEVSEKANGVYFELGYAKAKGKRIINIMKPGSEASFLNAAADEVITYKELEELKEKIKF